MVLANLHKKGRGFGLALFFVLSSVAAQASQDTEIFSRFETQMVSEPEPLNATFDKWGSDFERGERQWAVSELELGVRYHGVELSMQQRALSDLRLNADAADFYSRVNAEKALTPGESVPIYMQVNGFSAIGLRLGYRYEAETWQVTAGASYLKTDHLMDGELTGVFQAITASEYSVDASVDYVYYRDVIFKRSNVDEAQGTGRAFDLAAAWRPSETWFFAAQANDLFAEINWRRVPFTVADAVPNRKRYDEQGYAVFSPLFSGRQGYKDAFTQEVDPRYKFQGSYTHGTWTVHVEAQHQFDYEFGGFGASHRFGRGTEITALYWPELDSVELEWARNKWRAALALDHVLWPQVRTLTFNISYGY